MAKLPTIIPKFLTFLVAVEVGVAAIREGAVVLHCVHGVRVVMVHVIYHVICRVILLDANHVNFGQVSELWWGVSVCNINILT